MPKEKLFQSINPSNFIIYLKYLKYFQNEKTLTEVKSLIDNKDNETLQQIMLSRLLFGTAGLRGRMGAGYSCMNDLVIIQTSQVLKSLGYYSDIYSF